MQVKELWIYPIKSCQGIPLKTAEVTLKGLKWDRELMIVDKLGKFLTQRQFAKLAQIKVELSQDTLILSTRNEKSLFEFTPTLEGQEKPVQIWNDQTIAIDQGDKVAEWLQKSLDLEDVRLVRQSPKHIRPIDPNYAQKEDEPVSFSDGYPMLVTNTASLDELNRRLKENYPQKESVTVLMNRFRPNIVVETASSFFEDTWRYISIGAIEFTVIKSCSRCIITTTDQQTGERNLQQEPLRTLSQFRNFRGKILFGENLVPRKIGTLHLNDVLEVIRKR